MNSTKEFQPAIHRQLIRKKLMTPQESERIVNEWKLKNQIEKTTGETIKDMGLEEKVEDWLEMHGFPGEEGWEI